MKYLISHQIKVLAECFKDYKDVWDIVPGILHLSFKDPRLSMRDIKEMARIGNYESYFERILAGLKAIKDKGDKTLLRSVYGKIYENADTLLEVLNKLEHKEEVPVPVENSKNELFDIVEILLERAKSLLKRKMNFSENEKDIIDEYYPTVQEFLFKIEREIIRINKEIRELHKVQKEKEERKQEFIKEIKKGPVHTAKREIKVLLDMDSCITDFDKAVKKLGLKAAKGLAEDASEEEKQFMYDKIEEAGSKFWSDMDWYPKGQELWKTVKNYNPVLLSSPGLFKWAPAGKQNWVSENLPGISLFLESDKYIFAEPDAVLIDDSSSNIEGWKDAGGIGILYEGDPESVKEQLKKIKSQP